jgi:hypothetical protein
MCLSAGGRHKPPGSTNDLIYPAGWIRSPANIAPSLLAVTTPTNLYTTVLVGASEKTGHAVVCTNYGSDIYIHIILSLAYLSITAHVQYDAYYRLKKDSHLKKSTYT